MSLLTQTQVELLRLQFNEALPEWVADRHPHLTVAELNIKAQELFAEFYDNAFEMVNILGYNNESEYIKDQAHL